MSIMVSVGRYGGFSLNRGYVLRLCLGWVAIYFFPADAEPKLEGWLDWMDWMDRFNVN